MAVGQSLSVFVAVEVKSQNVALLNKFIHSLQKENDVVGCGEYDYLLLIHAKDMADCHQLTHRISHLKTMCVRSKANL